MKTATDTAVPTRVSAGFCPGAGTSTGRFLRARQLAQGLSGPRPDRPYKKCRAANWASNNPPLGYATNVVIGCTVRQHTTFPAGLVAIARIQPRRAKFNEILRTL